VRTSSAAAQEELPVVMAATASLKSDDVPDARAIYVQAGDENFPVASRLLPRAVRADLMAIYGFARLADDIGDEAVGDRLAMLAWLDDEVGRAGAGTGTHPVVRRLGRTIAARHLSLQPLRDLVEANRQDQSVHRYRTFEDLVGYCRLSAAPVGRLVLEVLGAKTDEREAWSDDVCIGLQVVEHLQDVAEDLAQDRIYLPLEDLAAEGCDEADLAAPTAGPAVRRVVAREVSRARELLASGAPLAASLPWRPRVAVAGFAAGGMAALDAIERADHDVLARRCRPRPARLMVRLAQMLASPAARRRRPAALRASEGAPPREAMSSPAAVPRPVGRDGGRDGGGDAGHDGDGGRG
jgi:squalene synthase HpnC